MVDQTQTRTIRIVVDASQARGGGAEAERALKNIQASAEQSVSALTRLNSQLASVATMLKTFVAAWVVQQITTFISALDKTVSGLGEVAEQLGINTNLLQAYQYAASQAGVSSEQLETAIGKFQRNLGEAQNGNKQVIDTLNQLGVKMLDASGKARDSGVVMSEAARAILNISDASKQAAAAADLFGRGGQKMLTLFAEMAKGPEAMIDAAKRAGVVIDESVIKKLDEMNDRASAAELKLRAMLAPLYADLKMTVLENLSAALEKIRVGGLEAAKVVAQLLSLASGNVGGIFGAEFGARMGAVDPVAAAEGRIAGAQAQISQAQTAIAQSYNGVLGRTPSADRRRAELQAVIEQQNKVVEEGNAELARLLTERDAMRDQLRGRPNNAASEPWNDKGGASNPRPTGSGEAAEKEYMRAKRALDDYMGSLRNEAEASQLSQREHAAMLAGIKAEALAREKVLGLTEDRIQSIRQEAEEYARANYDRDKALKDQEAAAKRNAELAMEPYKNALRSMQAATADFFQNMMNGGVSSFKSLAMSIKNIWTRMLSEMISQRLFSSLMGNGSGAGTGSSNPLGSLGSIGNISQLVGGARSLFGGLFGGGSGTTALVGGLGPSQGAGAFSGVIGSGVSSSGPSAAGGLGNLVGGSASGSAASAASAIPIWGWAMAAAMMAKGMLGPSGPGIRGGLSTMLGPSIEEWMANPKAAFGNVFNPLGGVFASGLGNMLGMDWLATGFGLFPGNKKPVAPQATQDIVIRAGRAALGDVWARGKGNVAGVAEGGSMVTDQLNRMIASAGLAFGPNAVGGYLLNSQGKNTGDQWIIGSGSYANGTATEIASGLDGGEAASRLIGEIIRRAAADGNVVETGRLAVSETMRKVLAAAGEVDAEEIQSRMDFARQYDEFLRGDGVGANIKNSILEIRESVNAMVYEAERLGIATAPLDAELGRRIAQTGTDFLTSLSDQVLGVDNPLALARLVNRRQYDSGLESLNALLSEGAINASQFADGLANLNRLLEISNQNAIAATTNGALGNIETLMRSLSYGPLSLASPSQTLSGMSASYAATRAQALAGDAGAIGRFAGQAGEYADYVNRYYGGNAQAASIRAGIFADAATIYASGGDPVAQLSGRMDTVLRAMLEMIEALRQGNVSNGAVADGIQQLVDALETEQLAPSNSTVVATAA